MEATTMANLLNDSSSDSPSSDAGSTISRPLTRMSSFEVDLSPRFGSVLVIGGNGFLGHTLVKQLLSQPTVTSISCLSRAPFKNRYDGVTYHIGDVTNMQHVRSVMEQVRPNVVFNTASPHAYVDHTSVPRIFAVNITGNLNLLQVASEVGTVKAYVYTSSAPIIAGTGGGYDHADETYPTLVVPAVRKGDPYHAAKAYGDKIVLEANRKNGIRTATVRPTALYGGVGDGQMVGPVIKALEDGVTNIWTGYNYANEMLQDVDMDVVHVENVARCHVLAGLGLLRGIIDPTAPKVDGEAFNVTDDKPSLPLHFFRKYWKLCGDDTPIEKVWYIHPKMVLIMAHCAEWLVWAFSGGSNRPVDLKLERLEFVLFVRTYDISKARERLGFKPFEGTTCKSQDEGIRDSVAWYTSPEVHGPVKLGGSASWPEYPFKLIHDTGASAVEDLPRGHYCRKAAQLMAQTHNTIFRALNAIYQQAPHVKPGTQDAIDFLNYAQYTYEFAHHHQLIEESFFFPELEKAARLPGLMDISIKEHELMDRGLEDLRGYAETTRATAYNADAIRRIIDNFKAPYEAHQHAEIRTILELHDKISSSELKSIYKRMVQEAERFSDIFKAAPWVMGCQDKNFILDGKKSLYPEVFFIAPYIIDIFMSGRHRGLWRYNPSTGYGVPRPVPTSANKSESEVLTAGILFPSGNKLKQYIPRSDLLVLLLVFLALPYMYIFRGDC